jgi:hypothetical protein
MTASVASEVAIGPVIVETSCWRVDWTGCSVPAWANASLAPRPSNQTAKAASEVVIFMEAPVQSMCMTKPSLQPVLVDDLDGDLPAAARPGAGNV